MYLFLFFFRDYYLYAEQQNYDCVRRIIYKWCAKTQNAKFVLTFHGAKSLSIWHRNEKRKDLYDIFCKTI